MEKLIEQLIKMNLTISACESITGGLFSKEITDISGASKYFKGSIVSYTNEIKEDVVKVDRELIKKYGVISSQCALAMAKNVSEIFNSNLAISFTGNAGPSASEGKPIGLVYIAILLPNKIFKVKEYKFEGTRKDIREKSVIVGIDFLLENLNK